MIKSFQENQTALFCNGECSQKLSMIQKVGFWRDPIEYAVLSMYEKMFTILMREELMLHGRDHFFERGER